MHERASRRKISTVYLSPVLPVYKRFSMCLHLLCKLSSMSMLFSMSMLITV